jgi:hypothetical protein
VHPSSTATFHVALFIPLFSSFLIMSFALKKSNLMLPEKLNKLA